MTIICMGALWHWTQTNSIELVVCQNHGHPEGGQNGHLSLPGNWD